MLPPVGFQKDVITDRKLNGGTMSISGNVPKSLSASMSDKYNYGNKNGKFPNSSPNASVFARLGFDYDPADDTILELPEDVKTQLNAMPRLMKDWQAEDMRNDNVGGYYKNPMAGSIDSFNSTIREILSKVVVSTVTTIDHESGTTTTIKTYVTFENANNITGREIADELDYTLDEGEKYKDHTDRLSGVVEPMVEPENTTELPHLDQVESLGRVLLFICNQTDGIMNTAPIIGSMTSLFTVSEINAYNTTLVPYPNLIANSIRQEIAITGEEVITTYVSNLSSNLVTTLVNTLRDSRSHNRNRRVHDENFYTNAKAVLKEFEGFNKQNKAGYVRNVLTNNYIGTEKLNESANIADVPPEFEAQIIYSPLGFMTVYNKTTGEVISSDAELERLIEEAPDSNQIITEEMFNQGQPPKPNVVVVTPPELTLDAYIEKYNANVLTVNVESSRLNVNTGAIIFRTLNGVWSNTRIIQITNITDNVYYYSNTATITNFGRAEVEVDVEDSARRRGIQTITVANTGTGYSNGTINVSGTGADVNATIQIKVNATSGAIRTANLISKGAFANTPTINVASLGGSNANLIAVLSDPINSLTNGESFNVSVRFRSLTEANTVDYGLITINPGIGIRVKGYSNTSTNGILLPSSITQAVGNSTNRLVINQFNGPYAIVDPAATGVEKWTFRNLSPNVVNIVSVVETTNSLTTNGNTHLNVQFYQANTPNVINTNGSVLWYANVKPLVLVPNASTFLVTTEDGQQREITITVDTAFVDDSGLYNEIINSNPDIIVSNSPFDIRVFGGKPNTSFTYSGPNISGTGAILSNGYALVANTTITNIGSYTYTITFNGTNHRRTLTKVITT
jgi:hypothetical protein